MPIPHPPRQVLLWTDDGAGKFSASVTLSQALCDGQWHQLAGEPGPSAWPDVPGGPTDPASVECLRGTWGGSFGPSGRGPLAKQRGWPPALVRGPAQLSHQSLCPTVTKSGNVLRLEVDAQSNQTLGPTRAISAYTLVPLHLGGLPGECGLSLVRGGAAPQGLGTGVTQLSALSPMVGCPMEAGLCSSHLPSSSPAPPDTQPGHLTLTHPWSSVYRGCMRNLVVNWSPVTLPPSARVHGAVGTSGCPAT